MHDICRVLDLYITFCIKHQALFWLASCVSFLRKNQRIPLAFGHFVGSFVLTDYHMISGMSGGGNASGTQTSMGRGEEGCGAHDHSENLGFRIAVFEIISSVLDAGMFLCFTVVSRLRLSLAKDCEERRH